MSLQASQLACERGQRRLFAGIDFEIARGEALWLRGGNGSGKTSLLRLLCGLAWPSTGAVHWAGRNIRTLREDFHRELMYLGHAGGVKDDLLAWENVSIGARLSGKPCNRDEACHALDQVGLLDEAHLPTRALSQGQRKRVALARLYVRPMPALVVLDEPFSALDQGAIDHLSSTLNQHLATDGIVVYTTHQPLPLQARRLHVLDLSQALPC